MLSDRRRVQAYRAALRQKVVPGCRVLDIGTGSGLLAMLAAKAGAGSVDAIEVSEVIELARRLVKHNDLEDHIRLHHSLSYQVRLSKPAELLVTETLGNFGLEEGIMGSVLDARMRLLDIRAALIPELVRVFSAPVELPSEYRKVEVWNGSLEELDFSAVGKEAADLLWYAQLAPENLLAPPQPLGEVNLRMHSGPSFEGKTTFTIQRDGMLHGLGGTFEAVLADDITVTNAVGSGSESWRQAFLPLAEPWKVEKGQQIEAEVKTWENGEHWSWTVSGPQGTLSHSTTDGYRSPLAGRF